MSYKFDEYKTEEILDNSDIVDVIEEFFPLKKAGVNYVACCPFHNEKTPSFVVSKQKQIYKCFGCGRAGNVSKFIMEYKNMGYFEALEYLARRAGVQLEEYKNGNNSKNEIEKKKEYDINKAAALYFHGNLRKFSLPYKYLKNRKIEDNIITKFALGYASPEWDSLLKHLIEQGFSASDIEKIGLIKKSQKTGKYYDVYRNRVIFPIIDTKKRVIGFGARILNGEGPKYINSPESLIFHKKNNLYGLNIAREKVRDDAFYLVEGYMDVIKMHSHGFETSVAALGTSLTHEQINLMKKYSNEFYICFDSDKAGLNAALRAINMFKSVNLNPKVIVVEGAKDPDEFLNEHSDLEFKALREKAKDYYDFLEFYYRDVYENSTKLEYIYKIFDNLKNINNDIEREIFLDKLSKKVKVTKDSLYNDFVKRYKKELDDKYKVKPLSKKNVKSKKVEQKKVNSLFKISIESELIRYIMSENELILKVEDMFSDVMFQDYEYLGLFRNIFEYYREHQKIDKSFIIKLVGEKFDVMNVLKECPEKQFELIFDDSYKRLKISVYKKYRLKLQEELKSEIDKAKKIEIVMEMQDCSKKILELN